MPYIKKKCRAGRTVDYEYHYSYRYNNGTRIRGSREKPTKEAQKQVNRRMAAKEATRILNANFGRQDYYITFTYRKECRPESEDSLKKHIRNLMNRLRKIQKKTGRVLKYVWVAEVGQRGATHIHMVVNHISLQLVRDAWEHGYTRVIPLDNTGQYRKLAEYLIKYSNKTEDNLGSTVGKRYNPSRNLYRPVPETKIISARKRIPDNIPVPRGYYLDKDSVRRGIHEITGYEYLNYTLIQLEGWEDG